MREICLIGTFRKSITQNNILLINLLLCIAEAFSEKKYTRRVLHICWTMVKVLKQNVRQKPFILISTQQVNNVPSYYVFCIIVRDISPGVKYYLNFKGLF